MDSKDHKFELNQLQREIREEVERNRNAYKLSGISWEDIRAYRTGFAHAMKLVHDNLSQAQQEADIGSIMLSMERFPKIIRWLAKFIARIILYFTQIITVPQRRYNQSMIRTVRSLLSLVEVRYEHEISRRREIETRLEIHSNTLASEKENTLNSGK